MEQLVEAILLGLVQGLTEFLPVSSSGHLAIFQALFDWEDPQRNLVFSIAVHLGSLGAVLVFARYEILAMLTNKRRLIVVLLVATLPLAALGPFLKPLVEHLSTNLVAVGIALLGTAALLAVVRRHPAGPLHSYRLPWVRALAIGCAQVLAVVPGVSRSGTTLAAGLWSGLEREQAVRFAFLMAAPAIFGAGLLLLAPGDTEAELPAGALVAGTAVSFVASLFAMKVMVGIVTKQRLGWFAIYCAAAGLLAIAVA